MISSGESCLVVSPVSRDKSGLAVLTTQGAPQLSLGRLLNSAVDRHKPVAKWAKDVPVNEPRSEEVLPRASLDELAESLGHLRVGEFRTLATPHLAALIELCLGRCADHFATAPVWQRPTRALRTMTVQPSVSTRPGTERRAALGSAPSPTHDARFWSSWQPVPLDDHAYATFLSSLLVTIPSLAVVPSSRS